MSREERPKDRARSLRRALTPPERKLWSLLRAHRLAGAKFSRQMPVGPFIVDFVARSRKLVIELDGDTHGAQVEYDARRTGYLEQQGYRVIRFTNAEMMGNAEGVLTAISQALRDSPLPTLSPEGRGL